MMKTQGKKFISPGAWFSLVYPSDWNEFEDMESCFLFYNPVKWTGNFRISVYKAALNTSDSMRFAENEVKNELKQTPSAQLIEKEHWKCVYLAESFQEEGSYYTIHKWIGGKDNVVFDCSFTVARAGDKSLAEKILSTLELRNERTKYPTEIIPVRVLEISEINEAYEWASSTIKKTLKKDFTASSEDIAKIQKIIEIGNFGSGQAEAWQSLGIAFGAILVNEINGLDWVTIIDEACEFPALRYEDTDLMVYPSLLIGEKMKNEKICDLQGEYDRIQNEIKEILQ